MNPFQPQIGLEDSEATAAVAVVHWVRPNETLGHILLIQRASDPRDPWSGHMSFPGGKREAGETLVQNAIRECREEVGLNLEHCNLQTLPVGIAGRAQGTFLKVQPFWFTWISAEAPDCTCQIAEVARTHWLALSDFLTPDQHSKRAGLTALSPDREFDGFAVPQGFLWGFSYGVLRRACGIDDRDAEA